jgi:alanyl-tRNA synthetase
MTMTGSELRQRFLDYFRRHGHTVVPSSPLVPAHDPTLLFTNAGMVQFKGVFLGEERRAYTRAATAQKCVRAGGKHNDLENVGRTARHHTFFEMLGNFSFMDYFKQEAVAFCWEFLTVELGLPKDRLKATVFTDDDDAFAIWKKVAGMGDERILRLGEKDNFWAMGDTGPCGPCSEVHFHQGEHLPCAEERAGRACVGPACECDRWLEIWNLVFMQFNRDASGTMTPLPKPSIDTGLGLERVAAVMQGKQSNFDTDLLRPLITRVERLASKRYGADAENDVSMRVIADHARAATFLITDGVTPSNEWRGYVLRRIMRRAMRHGRMLGLEQPFLWDVSAAVVEILGEAYPEIALARGRVADAVKQEEERFSETLGIGTAKIHEYLEAHAQDAQKVADGKFLFTLYDTHGFPTDLAQEVFQDAGWSVPPEAMRQFESEMEAQRERARAGASFTLTPGTASLTIRGEKLSLIYQELSAQLPKPEFLGYTQLATPARILALVGEGRRLTEAAQGQVVEVILDRTPAYAESGGQMGDTGAIMGREGQGTIEDTYYRGGQLIVHRVRVSQGRLRENAEVAVSVESVRRQGLRLHHTGTHLLHAALRRILGTHVTQAGSLVAPDHLRFDFSHGTGLKDGEVEKVEDLVNEHVQANIVVTPAEMDLQAALKSGAMALFGEKYGDRVRVVRIGDFSTELCGGTHLEATGQIGLFKVVSEGAVASGVRRIEAVTGEAARRHVGREEAALRESAGLLKIPPLELPRRLQKLLDEQKQLEKQLREFEARLAKNRARELAASAKTVAGVAVLAERIDGLDAEGLRSVMDTLRDRIGSGVIFLGSSMDGKVALVASVSKDLTKRFQAGKLVQAVAPLVGGKGGGRPDLAQGGGTDASRLDEALARVPDLILRAPKA